MGAIIITEPAQGWCQHTEKQTLERKKNWQRNLILMTLSETLNADEPEQTNGGAGLTSYVSLYTSLVNWGWFGVGFLSLDKESGLIQTPNYWQSLSSVIRLQVALYFPFLLICVLFYLIFIIWQICKCCSKRKIEVLFYCREGMDRLSLRSELWTHLGNVQSPLHL